MGQRWRQRLSQSRPLTWAQRHRAVLAGSAGITAIAVLVYSAWRGGGDWTTLAVAIAAVAVAWHFGRAHHKLGEVMRFLTLAPVLSAWFPDRYEENGILVHVQNAGNGPAMDVRATLLVRTSPDPEDSTVKRYPVVVTKTHLAPRGAPVVVKVREFPRKWLNRPRQTDVWIVHCADMNNIHYHAVSNFTHEKEGNAANEAFLFWRLDQSPQWILQNCERCKELGFR